MIYSLPDGWYKLNEAALQYLVGDAESWEQTAKVWEEAYNEQSENYRRYVQDSKRRYEQLQADVDKERLAWKRKLHQPGIGIFGGYGVNGWTIGVGLVWKVM